MIRFNLLPSFWLWLLAFDWAIETPAHRVQFGPTKAACSSACTHWNEGKAHQ
jgi:hypothetical protein